MAALPLLSTMVSALADANTQKRSHTQKIAFRSLITTPQVRGSLAEKDVLCYGRGQGQCYNARGRLSSN